MTHDPKSVLGTYVSAVERGDAGTIRDMDTLYARDTAFGP